VNGPATSRLGRQRGQRAPGPVRREDLGVGNEMYGPWQWGHMSSTQYPTSTT